MPRRPLTKYGWISCDDKCHKRRGSQGGTDYAVTVGTPVYAMFTGMARYRVAGTGGWTISINRDSSDQVGELMHLSRSNGFVLGGASRHVNEGDLVAWSGGAYRAPGAGSSTGPHLHAHVIVNGRRHGMEEYLANPVWAGGDVTPILIEETEGETDMMLIAINDGEGRYGPKSAWLYALFTPRGTIDLDPVNYAGFTAKLAYSYGERDSSGDPNGRAFNLTYEQWEWFHRDVVTAPGGGADNGPVLIAVAGVDAKVSALPTAVENGQAARTAIVK